ncbi:unnamed protein product [Ectocarpus sp. 6 AP-2014]
MGKQPTTFRIWGAAGVISHRDVFESFFDKLHERVALNYAFAAIGIPEPHSLLINLPHQPQEEGYPDVREEGPESRPWHSVHGGGCGDDHGTEVRPRRTQKLEYRLR